MPEIYYAKAKDLTELIILEENKDHAEHADDALSSFQEAINLDKENPLFHADRAKLYAILGNVESALADIYVVEKLGYPNDVTGMYICNTIPYVVAKSTEYKIEEDDYYTKHCLRN
jgi:regulator of sirC expression with transglutaminase-like and TPR domain